MTSPPPRSLRLRRVHDAIQRSLHRARHALRPGSSPHPPSPAPCVSSATSSIPTSSPSTPSYSEPRMLVHNLLAPPHSQSSTGQVALSTPSASKASASVTQHATSPGLSVVGKIKSTGNAAWLGLETGLHALRRSANEFPLLRSALDNLVNCLDIVQAVASNREDYEELASELTDIANTLTKCIGQLSLVDHVDSVARIASLIEAQVAHIDKQRGRGKGKRIVESINDRDDIIENYRQIEKLFRRLQSEISLYTLQNTNEHFSMTLLQRLSAVDDARYNSSYAMTIQRRACTPETRQSVQAELQSWVQDPNAAKVYWMNGMAGTGKTTIAYSLCQWLENNNLLGASFFCSRISSSCRTVKKIIPTIAYQLARYSLTFRLALCKVLKEDPDAGTLDVVQQFEKLVRRPMQAMGDWAATSVVVVIDALDECEDDYSTQLVLETMLRLGMDLPMKFFVSSRPEPVIRDKMLSSSGSSRLVLHLHDIEQWIVEADIIQYLQEELCMLSPPPSEEEIKQLAKLAGKLFIYAATVVRYIRDLAAVSYFRNLLSNGYRRKVSIVPHNAAVNSIARFKSIMATALQPASKIGSSRRYKELDELYVTILDLVFYNDNLEEEEIESMRLVLWTVLCAKEPMAAQTLASLLDIAEHQVSSALRPLRSVLHVNENNGLISTLHASFPDFMLDSARSGQFHCDAGRHSQLLAERCLDVMKEKLRFNICSLESSYMYDRDVADLDKRIKAAISPTLFYACRYFGEHLQVVAYGAVLRDKVVDFLTRRLLFWMEVLNLNQCIGLGAPALLQVHTWLSENGASSDSLKQATDAQSFVVQFTSSACMRSTPHIYISSLLSCPKGSSVYEHYWGHMRGPADVKETALSRSERQAIAAWSMDDPQAAFIL